MATSGSSNWQRTRDQIIYNALQHLGKYGIGKTIAPEDLAFANSVLNGMVKAWGTQGLHLWCKEEGVLYLTQYQAKYTLGNSSTNAYVALKSDEIVATLGADLVANDTAVTVTSTTGMTIGDYIGIVLDDKSLHWTTIATIPTSTTLTLTTGVTSAATEDNLVFSFTDRLYKPLRVLSARSVIGLDSGSSSTISEVQMSPIAYQTYMDLPVKTTNSSRPIEYHYNPKNTTGNMYVWPRPSDCACRIEFSYERIIEDLENAADDFDFPSEWQLPLEFGLAVLLGPAFGKDQKIVQTIGPMAADLLRSLKDWDNELDSIDLVPDPGYQ
jgi:hypothetical protein